VKMFKKASAVIMVAILSLIGFTGVASASGSSESSAYVDANNYYQDATSVDMTITKSTSGSVNWTAVMQYGHETGNYYDVSGTTKTGYVSPSSPSYRSWYMSSFPWGGNYRLKVTYSDGSVDYDYFFVYK
jgi:hypothetical protein